MMDDMGAWCLVLGAAHVRSAWCGVRLVCDGSFFNEARSTFVLTKHSLRTCLVRCAWCFVLRDVGEDALLFPELKQP